MGGTQARHSHTYCHRLSNCCHDVYLHVLSSAVGMIPRSTSAAMQHTGHICTLHSHAQTDMYNKPGIACKGRGPSAWHSVRLDHPCCSNCPNGELRCITMPPSSLMQLKHAEHKHTDTQKEPRCCPAEEGHILPISCMGALCNRNSHGKTTKTPDWMQNQLNALASQSTSCTPKPGG